MLNGQQFTTVFHRTDADSAKEILRTGRLKSHMSSGEIYAASREGLSGDATGYGDEVIALRVPTDKLSLDDEFPSGEKHYTFKPRHAEIVGAWRDPEAWKRYER
jgi:hypothetical protein